jgi:hypothetical protein
MYQSETAPWLEFYAWDTDGTAKTDLVYNTAGISIVVVRDNLANSAALTLSAASGPTDWAAGKFHAMGGNKYRVGIATASISSFTGQISVEGTYTGGVVTGVTREVSAYNPAANPMASYTQPTGFLAASFPTDPADQSAVEAAITAAQVAIIAQVDSNETKIDAIQSDTNDIQTRLPSALESGRIAAVLDSTATAALVDLIWDEPLTGATHNVAASSGKRLRQTTAFQQIDSTVIDASATTTTFVTGLTSSVDNFYNDSMLVFTDGALAGQVRAIYDYIGATKTIVLAEALTSAPVDGVAFAVISLHIHPVSQIQNGLATAAALATESTKINRIEAVATGTVTGAGTSTEVFVGPSATLTITVDSSGNRSAVVVT